MKMPWRERTQEKLLTVGGTFSLLRQCSWKQARLLTASRAHALPRTKSHNFYIKMSAKKHNQISLTTNLVFTFKPFNWWDEAHPCCRTFMVRCHLIVDVSLIHKPPSQQRQTSVWLDGWVSETWEADAWQTLTLLQEPTAPIGCQCPRKSML